MATFRVSKERNYTVVDNYYIDDENLSLKAKGLLTMFLRRPDDWDIYLSDIQKYCKDKKDGLSSAVKELEERGYIVRLLKRDEKGKLLGGYDYLVKERPEDKTELENLNKCEPKSEKPKSEKPKPGKTEIGKSATTKYLNKLNTNIVLNTNTTTNTETKKIDKNYFEVVLKDFNKKDFESIYDYVVKNNVSVDVVVEKLKIINSMKKVKSKVGALITAIRQDWQPNTPASNNKLNFDNFESRDYDYDDLEQQLLGWKSPGDLPC